jgi:hypothetical protein
VGIGLNERAFPLPNELQLFLTWREKQKSQSRTGKKLACAIIPPPIPDTRSNPQAAGLSPVAHPSSLSERWFAFKGTATADFLKSDLYKNYHSPFGLTL